MWRRGVTKSVGGFALYQRVNALKEPLTAGDSFDATCWRLLLDVVDLQKEKERFREALRRSSHVTCRCGDGMRIRFGGGGECVGADDRFAGGEGV